MIRFLSSLAFLGLFLGCSQDTLPQIEVGYAYYPLETGRYMEYEITETRYALARAPEIRTYQIRETIGEKYTDPDGQDVYRTERAIREGTTWKTDSIGTAWLTPDRAFRKENGLIYVKLEFPVYAGKIWNGNQYNTLGKQSYTITEADHSGKTGSLTFDNMLTVVQQNDSTLLSLRKKQEKYAKSVGLIEWEQVDVQFCGTPDCLGKGIINYGFSRIGRLKNYGK